MGGVTLNSVSILKLVAETTRLRILNLLVEERLCVCELQEILDLPQVSVSKHLTKLRELAFTKTKKEGNRIFYELSDDFKEITWIKNLILELREREKVLVEDYKSFKKHSADKKEEYYCPK